MTIIQGLIGLFALVGLAWLVSENRARLPWRTVLVGIAIQLVLALVLLKWSAGWQLLLALNGIVEALQAATRAGTSFVFGYIGGGALPFDEKMPGGAFVLAFQALPLVLLVSALSALLYHWRVLPAVVGAFAWALSRLLRISGAASFSTTANIFIGFVEAPLLIRPYLNALSRSELFVVMTAGMATIAGTVMVLYATALTGIVENPIGHLLTASLLSAPAAVLIARVMIPEDAETVGGSVTPERVYDSTVDAITRGTLDGLTLLLNIVAMLIVIVALVHLVNLGLGLLPDLAGAPITLERLLGYVMAPVAWLMGIPWSEAVAAGSLLGIKVVLNEFIAYFSLAGLPEGALGERSRLIMTYALCGFANFASLGILIAGIGAMVPERRLEIVGLGLRSIYAGTLAACMTGTVVGLLSV